MEEEVHTEAPRWAVTAQLELLPRRLESRMSGQDLEYPFRRTDNTSPPADVDVAQATAPRPGLVLEQ